MSGKQSQERDLMRIAKFSLVEGSESPLFYLTLSPRGEED
jgi:hypothetical protein